MKCKNTFCIAKLFAPIAISATMQALPVMADSGDLYELVTNSSQITANKHYMICDKDNIKALRKDFYNINADETNTVPVETDGDYFVVNDNVATFTLETTKNDKALRLDQSPSDAIAYIAYQKNSRPALLSKSNAYITIKINSAEKVQITSSSNCLNRKAKGNVIFFNSTISSSYINLYKKLENSTTSAIALSQLKGLNESIDGKDTKGKVVAQVTIDRTFVADGGWYTLCLPFSLSSKEIATNFKGGTFYEFKGVQKKDGHTNLLFGKVTATKAGRPYMFKPTEDITADDMVFKNKVFTATEPTDVRYALNNDESLAYTFKGTFCPISASSMTDNNIRFLGGETGMDLTSTNGSGTMRGYRAYFVFPSVQGAADTKATIVEDDTPTAISATKALPNDSHAVYTVTGQRIKVNPSRLTHGMYIINGKKVVIK